jgi:hypothetical protein
VAARHLRLLQHARELWNQHDITAAPGRFLSQPIGWPCEPFANADRVIAFVLDTLIHNGFRPNAGLDLINRRQIVVAAIRDGIEYGADSGSRGDHEPRASAPG